jgi:hypothetical protein
MPNPQPAQLSSRNLLKTILARSVSAGLALILAAACATAQSPSPSVEQPTIAVGASPAASTAVSSSIQIPNPTMQPTASTASATATAPIAPTLAPEPTSQPTALPSAIPTAVVTPEPIPEPSGLVIDWREKAGDRGFGTIWDDTHSPTFHSGAVFANRYYIASALEDEDYNADHGLWSSADGLSWERVAPDLGRVYMTAANATGLLVQSDAGMMLTTNGSDWEHVSLSVVAEGWVSTIGATSDGFVAIGSGAWTSTNGRDWLPIETPTALDLVAAEPVAMTSYGDQLVALTGGRGIYVCCGPLVAWTSTNLVDWTRGSTLPGTRTVSDPVLAGGPLGWIVTGSYEGRERTDMMFWSGDGLAWEEVSGAIGPVSDVLVDDTGYVAVGSLYIGTGCAVDPAQIQGLTWTSTDGRTWTPMPLEDLLYKRIDHLFRNGRSLIGVGLSYEPEGGISDNEGIFIAKLPPIAPQGPGPAPAPTPEPDGGGCGPR